MGRKLQQWKGTGTAMPVRGKFEINWPMQEGENCYSQRVRACVPAIRNACVGAWVRGYVCSLKLAAVLMNASTVLLISVRYELNGRSTIRTMDFFRPF